MTDADIEVIEETMETEPHKMSYLQLLILIDYDDMPKRIKCRIDNEIYIWDADAKCYEHEHSAMNLSSFLLLNCSDSKLASDMSLIEVIEE